MLSNETERDKYHTKLEMRKTMRKVISRKEIAKAKLRVNALSRRLRIKRKTNISCNRTREEGQNQIESYRKGN